MPIKRNVVCQEAKSNSQAMEISPHIIDDWYMIESWLQ